MKLNKVLALVLALALVITSFAACAGTPAEETKPADESTTTSEETTEEPADGAEVAGDAAALFAPKNVDDAKNININAGMEPTGLNSLTCTYSIEFSLLRHLYETLVSTDENGAIIPAAAESWDFDEETLTYTFHLRDDGVWSNGDKVTANDFAFAWSQVLNPEVAADYAYFLYFIKNGEAFFNGEVTWEEVGVKVVDDLTLEVVLEQPCAYALQMFAFGTMCPVNQRFYEAVGADLYATEAQYYCTNGAYALTEWSHNEKIVTQLNDAFHGAADIEVEQITWKIITDANAAMNSFLAGDLDMVGLGTGELIKQAEAAGYTPIDYTDGSAFYIYFNHENEYLANVNLRKALHLALDRESEITNVWQNNSLPMTSFTPDAVVGADGTPFQKAVGELYPAAGDQEKAKEYLATALSELGCTVEDLSANLSVDCGDGATSVAHASFLQEQWRTVLGIEVTVNPMITKQAASNRSDGNFCMSVTGWGPDYNDPNTFLDLWVSNGGNNDTRWSSERYDELIALAAVESDMAKRQEYFIECEQIIADELPVAPDYWRVATYALSDKIESGMVRNSFTDIDCKGVKLS